jgi:hypothetical protein
MRVAHPVRELGLTSHNPRVSCLPYPQSKLTGSNNRKSSGDGNVFPRHGVYSVSIPSGSNSEMLEKKTEKFPT